MMSDERTRERTIRPRILSAVLRLQTFTVQEIVSSADLTGRKQAYSVLKTLEDEKIISCRSLPATQPSRPEKLYSLTEDETLLRSLAKSILKYGIAADLPGNRTAYERALERGDEILRSVERSLSRFEPSTMNSEQVSATTADLACLSEKLEDVEIDLETARLESLEPQRTGDGISRLHFRLGEVKLAIEEMSKAVRRRHSVIWIRTFAENWSQDVVNPIKWARKILKVTESRLSTEILLDLLSPGLHRKHLMPAVLASQAMRTNDLELIRSCLTRLTNTDSPWIRLNQLSTEFLLGNVDDVYPLWHETCLQWQPHLSAAPRRKGYSLAVFIYSPANLHKDTLLRLFERYEVSIVSPHNLAFLSLSEEVVRPILVDPVSQAWSNSGPLTTTIVPLNNESPTEASWDLFAYGPLATVIRQWPGAPALRVAASVDGLVSINVNIPRVANALRDQRGVVVLEGKSKRGIEQFRLDAEMALGEVEQVEMAY